MIRARSLSEIVDRYDAFLVDQYGVLLDGAGLYDHARGVLDELAARGKTVLLISNSGKRSAPNVARLASFGVSRATFLDVLSSGEVAYREMQRRIGVSLKAGARVWIEVTDPHARPAEGLDLSPVQSPDEADLLWIAGCRPFERSLEDYARLLAGAARRGVPAICANPDMTMLTPSGAMYGAGAVARTYEELGGAVEWFGKPYPAIYEEALRRLGRIARARVLAVGDSPAHDILGGARAGVATALVRTGVHESESEAELLARCERLGVAPDILLPRFAF
ncbi:MAG TPA: TIGR01459 family HAD-type hydrolase [Roseiarcus sp.]|nr:TIGR01459 family HAD-type hydrolase [Roseiarcus sp.]